MLGSTCTILMRTELAGASERSWSSAKMIEKLADIMMNDA